MGFKLKVRMVQIAFFFNTELKIYLFSDESKTKDIHR